MLIRAIFGKDARRRRAAMTIACSLPRQNGKNEVLIVAEGYILVAKGGKILHTAHRVGTSTDAFERLKYYFDRNTPCPQLEEMLLGGYKHGITRVKGAEEIRLSNGGRIAFGARSKGGFRGFAGISLVVFDEAQTLSSESLRSMMYTLAASKTSRQLIFFGTPPGAEDSGEVFSNVRNRALSGDTKGLAYYEWSIPDLGSDRAKTVADKDLWYATNPALGVRLDEEFTEEELRNTPFPEDFARERLGWWAPVATARAAISESVWDGAAIPAIGGLYPAKTAFGVKFSPDGSGYALAGCKLDRHGNAAVELVETGTTATGTKALAAALRERADRASVVVVDGQSGADALCDNLAELKAPRGYVYRPRTGDVIAASVCLLDGLQEGTVAHTVSDALEDSAKHSVRRPIGNRGGWGFGSSAGHDSTAIEACALALWGIRNSRRNPKRKQRVLL